MRLSDALRFATALGAALSACLLLATAPNGTSVADASTDPRKLPMRFDWHACRPDCGGWVSAQGIITAESPAAFEAFARDRDLTGATIVLDSAGGSVVDAMTLGRRMRTLAAVTTVGRTQDANAETPAIVQTRASCESMCVFLLLSGAQRYVPDDARVRVHQIWMGDRAEDARAASYTAEDMMIVERDIGRLAKFTFDMGGTGDLLALALNVPPWEDLHELTPAELRSTNLVTTDIRPDALLPIRPPAMAAWPAKPVQDRFAGDDVQRADASETPARTTRTAEATGGTAAAAAGR